MSSQDYILTVIFATAAVVGALLGIPREWVVCDLLAALIIVRTAR